MVWLRGRGVLSLSMESFEDRWPMVWWRGRGVLSWSSASEVSMPRGPTATGGGTMDNKVGVKLKGSVIGVWGLGRGRVGSWIGGCALRLITDGAY